MSSLGALWKVLLSIQIRDQFNQSTLREVLYGYVVELLLLLHDELFLVDLDDERSTPLAPPCETKFAERILYGLRDIDCVRLCAFELQSYINLPYIELTMIVGSCERTYVMVEAAYATLDITKYIVARLYSDIEFHLYVRRSS